MRCPGCEKAHRREANREKQARWREANPETYRAAQRKSYEVQRAKPGHLAEKRDRALKKYGISRDDLDALIAAQDGKCAICKGAPTGKGDRLHVDHCHTSGKVRALLCHHCNTLLGLAGDDPARLRAAAAYLEAHT